MSEKDINAEADAIEQRAVQEADAETNLAEVLADIQVRLEALEQHFTTQGLNELASAIERRIVSRMRYGRSPTIEKS